MKEKSFLNISEETNYKVVALFISLILWVWILSNKDSVIQKHMKIHYALPAGVDIVGPYPKEIQLTISGRRLTLNKYVQLDEPYEIDLVGSGESTVSIRLKEDTFEVPSGVNIVKVTPRFIKLKLEQIISKDLPIEVIFSDPGAKPFKVIPNPDHIQVTGPRSLVDTLKTLPTFSIDSSGINPPATLNVPLKDLDSSLTLKNPGPIEVKIEAQ